MMPRTVFSWIVVFLFPLYSLPWVIYRMFRYEEASFIQFAFFMGLAGMLYPPSGDLYMYLIDYNTYQGISWDMFLVFMVLKFDYLLSFLSYGLGRFDIPFDISRFIFNFWGYYLIGKLFLHITKTNQLLKEKEIRIKVVIFFIGFAFNAYLYRYSLALMLFTYGAYYIIYEKKRLYWSYVIISILCHFALIVSALILFLSQRYYLEFKKEKWYFLFSMIMIFFILINGYTIDLRFLLGPLAEMYGGYLDPNDMGAFVKGFSLKLLLWHRFIYLLSFVCLMFYIRYRNKGIGGERSMINYLFLINTIFSPYNIVFGRFFSVLTIFAKVFLLKNYDGSRLSRKYLRLLFYMTLILTVLNVWAKRREVSVSDMPMLFRSTSFGVLSHSYSDYWVDQNITEGGDLIEFKE